MGGVNLTVKVKDADVGGVNLRLKVQNDTDVGGVNLILKVGNDTDVGRVNLSFKVSDADVGGVILSIEVGGVMKMWSESGSLFMRMEVIFNLIYLRVFIKMTSFGGVFD